MITLCNLPNDLDFWIETDRFRSLYIDNENSPHQHKEKELKKKAQVLVDCFLDSKILPKNCDTFINVPQDIRHATATAVGSGIIDGSVFSDCANQLFPIMIHYWKIYREKYAITVYSKWKQVTSDAVKLKEKNRAQQTLRNKLDR